MESSCSNKLTASESHRTIIARLDKLVDALPLSSPLYSKDLAGHIGTSARTLQAASHSITGISLHRYLRLKRLSRVRPQLLTGARSVKEVALGNGFWSLGDFARSYAQAFGELPLQTLARLKTAQFKQQGHTKGPAGLTTHGNGWIQIQAEPTIGRSGDVGG
jgi:AraC-like DNA-binding protein